MQVNIIAMFSITKAAVEHMKPGSTIVNMSSVAGGRQGSGCYFKHCALVLHPPQGRGRCSTPQRPRDAKAVTQTNGGESCFAGFKGSPKILDYAATKVSCTSSI